MKSSIIAVFVFASTILFSQDYIYDGKPISETAFQNLYKKCAGYYAMDKNGNVYNVSRFNLKPPKQGDAFTVQGEAKRDLYNLIKMEYTYQYLSYYSPASSSIGRGIFAGGGYITQNRLITIYIAGNIAPEKDVEVPILILQCDDDYYMAEQLLPIPKNIFANYIRENRLFRWVEENKKAYNRKRKCGRCSGSGKVVGTQFRQKTKKCPVCSGAGIFDDSEPEKSWYVKRYFRVTSPHRRPKDIVR